MTTSDSNHTPHLTVKPWWVHDRAKKTGKITAAIIAAGVIIWFFAFHPFVSTDDARVAVTLVRVAPEGAGGRIVKLNIKEGDRVKKDAVLLELDHGVAEANLLKAKAHATLAEQELSRNRQLASQHGIPQRDYDNTLASTQSAQADLQLAQIAYDRTFIKSPIDGIVVQKVTEEGNLLEQNQTAVTVADVDHAWISANIEETRVGRVKAGQAVTVSIDEGGKLTGHVTEVRDATAAQFALIQAENPSGNFTKLVQRVPIKIELDAHPDKVLRAGQSVEISIRVL